MSTKRTVVGIVDLTANGSDRLVVLLVHRTWTTSSTHNGVVEQVRTVAPPGIEVRREPPTSVDEPGGMSEPAAMAMVRLVAEAAARVRAQTGAAPPRRRRSG